MKKKNILVKQKSILKINPLKIKEEIVFVHNFHLKIILMKIIHLENFIWKLKKLY